MAKHGSFRAVEIQGWDDAKRLGEYLSSCVFRGQEDERWRLRTTLDRAFDRHGYVTRIGLKSAESEILTQFKRRARSYLPNGIGFGSDLEWLAAIQNHGGPTRLLDFTWSFYVAAFFALERANTDAAIWAVDATALDRSSARAAAIARFLSRDSPDDQYSGGEHWGGIPQRNNELAEVLLSGQQVGDVVLRVAPVLLTERQAAQQGVFLFPGTWLTPFDETLEAALALPSGTLRSDERVPLARIEGTPFDFYGVDVVKVIIPRRFRAEVLWNLEQMNMNAASLFPGLDGFARSMNRYVARRESITTGD